MVIGALVTLEKFRWVVVVVGGPVNYSVTPVQTGSQELGVRSLEFVRTSSGLSLDNIFLFFNACNLRPLPLGCHCDVYI